MKYTLIKGNFHIVGHSPDGDSIKFKANNPARWDALVTVHREKLNENIEKEDGAVQLRLQGVDALETHYTPPPISMPKDLNPKDMPNLSRPSAGGHEQPHEFGQMATDKILEILGVQRVEWRSGWGRTWIDKAYVKKGRGEICFDEKYQDKIPGYIVTNDAEKNGRPISWVFAGSTSTRDGTQLSIAQLAARLHRCANYKLLRAGLVYPYFYMTLPAKLRDKLTEATKCAYEEAKSLRKPSGKSAVKVPNLWLYDRTVKGVNISELSAITERYEFYPYLFRRVLKHWYHSRLEKYWAALAAGNEHFEDDSHDIDFEGFFKRGNPYLFVVSERDFLRLDDILSIRGNRIKLTKQPFDIVFLQ